MNNKLCTRDLKNFKNIFFPYEIFLSKLKFCYNVSPVQNWLIKVKNIRIFLLGLAAAAVLSLQLKKTPSMVLNLRPSAVNPKKLYCGVDQVLF